MPRFKDENDFPDVEIGLIDRPSLSSEAVSNNTVTKDDSEIGRRLDDDLEFRSDRVVDPRRSVGYRADTVPSPKAYESDDDDDLTSPDFIEIQRPSDARRSPVRSSNSWPSTLYGTPVRMKVNNVSTPVFANPSVAIPCVERVVRREVMFAKRRAGRGGKKRRQRRRNYWSKVVCY